MPTVLIIGGDDASMLELLTEQLERAEYTVLATSSGERGVECCRETEPDAVLCSWHLPGMGALDVIRALVALNPELPILIISDEGQLTDAVRALKSGAWDYILASTLSDADLLEHAVRHALERAAHRRRERLHRLQLEEKNLRLQQSLQQLREDEEAGRRLQFQLLPRDDVRYDQYRFHRHLLTSLYLSGDFVDYFYIDERHLGFYMADVSGHGVPSAFVTVLLKSYMSRYLELHRQGKSLGILDPSKILTRLNRNVLDGDMGKYLTMFYGVLQTDTNQLTFSNGGQFPLPLLCADQQCDFIGDKNLPVGLFDFAEYHNQVIDLPDNFSMILISDGILEILEQRRLQDKLNFLLSLNRRASNHIESILEELGIDGEAALPDDVTLLLIQREA